MLDQDMQLKERFQERKVSAFEARKVSESADTLGGYQQSDYHFGRALEKLRRSTTSAVKSRRHQKVNATTLARRWNISLAKAKLTCEGTTQRAVRTLLNEVLSRRFTTNDRMLRY